MSTAASPFTLAAVNALRRLYPEDLADKSFDNTGLLLEAPKDASERSSLRRSVLLTIDLTTSVAEEAIAKKVSLVVAYHPIIFRPLKSLTLANTQQRSLLRLASEGISVYCPHTAVDAAAAGNATWLANVLAGQPAPPSAAPLAPKISPQPLGSSTDYLFHHFPAAPVASLPGTTSLRGQLSAIQPSPARTSDALSIEGMGRLLTLDAPVPLVTLLTNLANGLGGPKAFNVALPYPGQSPAAADVVVRTAGVCAGSGGSVLAKADPLPDLFVTGEMSHHEALAYAEAGKTIVCVGHSNSERAYLRQGMHGLLQSALQGELSQRGLGDGFEIHVSDFDVDPFGSLVAS